MVSSLGSTEAPKGWSPNVRREGRAGGEGRSQGRAALCHLTAPHGKEEREKIIQEIQMKRGSEEKGVFNFFPPP